MAETKEYSGKDKKFMLQYPAGSNSQKPSGYIFKERFQVDVKVITDPSNFGQYPVSTHYDGSRKIGELLDNTTTGLLLIMSIFRIMARTVSPFLK